MDSSGTFIDLDSTSSAYWSVRRLPDMIALGLSIEANGDIDVAFDRSTAKAIAVALIAASEDD